MPNQSAAQVGDRHELRSPVVRIRHAGHVARLLGSTHRLARRLDADTEGPSDAALRKPSRPHLREERTEGRTEILVAERTEILDHGSGSEGHLWEHHVNDWRWSLDVNVMGVVNGINAFVPTMLAQDEEGHVVNTTSDNGGFTPLINSAVYATTKAAVITVTECLGGSSGSLVRR